MEILWNETPKARWQDLMDTSGTPFQQSWTYGEVAQALGAQVHRFEIRAAGESIALAQAIERWCFRPVMLITMGPVWLKDLDIAAKSEVLRTLKTHHGGVFIDTPPNADSSPACKAAGLKDVMTPATLASLPLGPHLRAKMHVKWRNRLTAAEASGLTVTRDDRPKTLDWLLTKDRQQQKTRRYRALPPAFTRTWATLAPKSLLLATTGKGDTPDAAMLFLRHGKTATYHIGWSGPEGRARNAHNLILAKAARMLGNEGVDQINLGLLDTETAPGLARFKLGAGARPVQTGGTWIGL